MSKGVNKVILVGNLGADPEVRYLPSGAPVATVRLATSESWKDKQTGQLQERTEWHRVVLFNRLGEIAGQYLKKGSKIYVEGSLRTQKWQDKTTGQDRFMTEIVGSNLQMLDSRGQAGGPSSGDSFNPPMDLYSDQMGGDMGSAPKAAAPKEMTAALVEDNFEDDVPF